MDNSTQKAVAVYLSSPNGKLNLARSMMNPLVNKLYPYGICQTCGMLFMVSEQVASHTDEECCVNFIMGS